MTSERPGRNKASRATTVIHLGYCSNLQAKLGSAPSEMTVELFFLDARLPVEPLRHGYSDETENRKLERPCRHD